MKNVLVTGASGFIGKNLVVALKNMNIGVYEYNKHSTLQQLEIFTKDCDFVFHLASAIKPENVEDFKKSNEGLTKSLIECLKKNKNNCSILFTSTTQVGNDSPYSVSKLNTENILKLDEEERGINHYIFRLSNVFGKWAKPNYNSFLSTMCYSIPNKIEVSVENPSKVLTLVYIDDVVKTFIDILLNGVSRPQEYYTVEKVYNKTIQECYDLILSFTKNDYAKLDFKDEFTNKLYATYLTYLTKDQLVEPLKENIADTGSCFVECFKYGFGQISVNKVAPYDVRGNHYHNSKVEKFIVVDGECFVRLERLSGGQVFEYKLSDKDLKVLTIPPGYVHTIVNHTQHQAIILIWCNEAFDKDNADTIKP